MAIGPQAILGRMEQRWRFDVEQAACKSLPLGVSLLALTFGSLEQVTRYRFKIHACRLFQTLQNADRS